jgi:4-amino-4-deoxy-L-arabinose transferase-like glycosyltransferase
VAKVLSPAPTSLLPRLGASPQALTTRHPVWVLLAIAVAVRLVAVSVRFTIGTDEGLFLTLGRNLAAGLGYTGNGEVIQIDFPPGFSLFAAAVYALGGWPELPSQLNVVVVGSLLVLPIYWLARQLTEPATALRAGLFTALLPALVLAQGNFEAVAEPLYSLLLFTGWALLWWALSGRRLWAFALAGLAVGLAHLVRWEGLVMAALAAGVVVLALRRAAVAPVAVFLAGVAVCAVPYAAFLYAHTGSVVTPKAAITRQHAAALAAGSDDPFAYEKAYSAYEAFLANPRQSQTVPPTDLGTFARRYAGNVVAEVRLWLTSLSLMTVVWLLPAALGAWRLRWFKTFFLALHLIPLAAIPASVVDPRYFLPALPALMLFAAAGWPVLFERLAGAGWRRALSAGMLAATLGLFTLGALAGPFLFPRSLEYKTAGLALNGLVPPGAHMLARKRQVPFYAGAYWQWLPYGDLEAVLAYARDHDADYLVVDAETTPALRPQLAFLLEPSAAPPGLTPIYVSASGPKVVVYRIER